METAKLKPGDRVRSICMGKYYGRAGVIRKRYCFDSTVYFVVDLDPDPSGGDSVTCSFAASGLVPADYHPDERKNKAICYP